MKNKRIGFIFGILIVVILVAGYFGIKIAKEKNSNEIEDYIPEEEISEEQSRQTIVSLYFQNSETKKLESEARLVDIKDMMNLPYEKLVQLLIDGPKNSKYERLISEDTKINKTFIEKDVVTIDFSEEFLNFDDENKENLIKSIVKTLTELTEVNGVNFLINGEVNADFSETYVRE
jgi:germination protein M